MVVAVDNQNSAEALFLSYFKEASAVRWNDVIVKTKHHTLTKQDIFDYYSDPAIRRAILSQLKEGPSIVHQNFSDQEPVLKRWEKGEPIHIRKDSGDVDDPKDYTYWIERRATEFHPTLGEKTKRVWVDLDPHESVEWKKTKDITGKVSDLIYQHPNVYDVEIRFSGGRGFHVLGELDKEMSTIEAKKLIEGVIAPMLHDKTLSNTPPRKGQIRLDTSTFHNAGSLRGLYSLNKNTGLVCVPVEEEHLSTFEPHHATIDSVIGGRPRRAKSIRL